MGYRQAWQEIYYWHKANRTVAYQAKIKTGVSTSIIKYEGWRIKKYG